MKTDTEWRYGNLALVLNLLSVIMMAITLLISFEQNKLFSGLVLGFGLIYFVTIIILYFWWLDKFKYIED